ncbi:MAG: NAD/NADP octopine/nopaline dehydrogenase family protein [Pseudomonadota bacterium]|nr:NAD/NADP octopine/nopaline dehydrogenase family protein [Pseudomonadota bacterium]
MAEICVLGGGNGSYAAAGDLTLKGHRVRLWRRDRDRLQELRRAGNCLAVRDAQGVREAEIADVTDDIGEAMRGADLILVPTPAFSQPDIARLMAPHLADGQVVYLPPGTFGSFLMARIAREQGSTADVAFAETGTLPWLARKRGPREVAISARAKRLPTGVFPERRAAHALDVIRAAFPDAVEPAGDALSAALLNGGPTIHPPLIVMNAGPIQHFPHWDIHNEGTQPAIRRVTDALDEERVALRETLGYGAPHFRLRDHYATEGEEWMYGRRSHDSLVKSGDWREPLDLARHRYMREDVALGLSLLVSAAEWAGVPCPLARAFLSIGGAICGEDFRQTGRTFESLGLSDYDRAGLKQLLAQGFPE